MKQTESNISIEKEALTLERRKALLIEAGFPEQLLSSETFVFAGDIFVTQQTRINEQQTLIEQKDARIIQSSKPPRNRVWILSPCYWISSSPKARK